MVVNKYILIGYPQYVIENKVLYRVANKIKHSTNKFHYISKRAIKRTFKDNQEGYYLVKNGKRKFKSLKILRHRLKKVN